MKTPMPTDPEPEVLEESMTPFAGDQMEVLIEVAKHLGEFEKALDAILNFVIKRCYAGDFVSHDRANTPPADRTVNIVGAAAERIARDLGIQESNRTQPEKAMDDKHPGHYNYSCEGDFTFRDRTIHAVGIASTLNPFYSKAGGVAKDPKDIREEYIVRDAWRDCTKQGVKSLLGLRKIPLMKLKELGYDISKVKYVNFQQGEKSAAATNPAATAAPEGTEQPKADGEIASITIDKMEAKVSRKGKPFYSVVDSEGAKYYAWGDAKSEKVSKLLIAYRDRKSISVILKTDTEFTTIEEVLPSERSNS